MALSRRPCFPFSASSRVALLATACLIALAPPCSAQLNQPLHSDGWILVKSSCRGPGRGRVPAHARLVEGADSSLRGMALAQEPF